MERYVFCGTDGTSWEELVPVPAAALPDPSSPLGHRAGALTSCSTLGPQNIAVLYVTWPDPTGQQASMADVEAAFFGADPSLKGYWEEASYGQTTATGAVFGPYLLPQSYTCSPADISSLNAAAMAAADADVDFTQYSRIVVVSPQGPDSGCAILGVSQLGCSQKSTPGDGTFTASITNLLDFYMVPQDRGAILAAHELGHALGLGHSNSLDYDLDVMAPVGKSGFGTNTEYGGPYSAMAQSTLHKGHYGAPHKARLGWLEGRYATVEADGSYHLSPYEEAVPAGLQALKVRRAAGIDEWLWLELRTPTGPYDQTLDPLAFTGALVHLQASATDTKSYVLDLTPPTTTFRDGVLTPGAPLLEPYTGMTLTAANLDPSGVDVSVGYGVPTCNVTAPTVGITPALRVTTAGTATTFDVTVNDNDAPSCPTGTFQLTALRPSGWGAGYAPTPLQIAPGQSAPTVLSITPAASAAVGSTTTITARSFRYGWFGDATAAVFVCGTGAPATLTMTPAAVSVEASFPASFTVSVRNNDCSAQTFSTSASAPAGWITELSAAALSLDPGQTGSFVVTATSPASAAPGGYLVGAGAGGGNASATANLTAAQTRVTTSVPGGPFHKNDPLALVSTVTYGSEPAPAGVPVTFSVKRKSGQTQTLSASTAVGGVASATYTPTQVGNHTAWSVATYPSGNSVTSAVVGFAVVP